MNEVSANKRLAKNTLVLYFRMLFMMAINLFTSRVVLQTLGVDDFGIYNVVGGVIMMFGFITASMSAGASRFITIAIGRGDELEMRTTFGGVFAIQIFLMFLILMLGETIGLWFVNTCLVIPDIRQDASFWVYQFSIIACLLSVINVPLNAEIIAHEKMSVYAHVTIIDAVLKLLVVYLLHISSFDKLIVYALLIIVVQLIDVLIAYVYCYKNFNEVKGRIKIDYQLSKSVLKYSSWTLTGAVTSMTCNQGINILLNIFFGPVVNAARGIAVQVQIAVQNFATSFQTALNPQIVKSYATNDYRRIEELVAFGTRISFYLLLLISLPIALKVNFLLELWLTEIPKYTDIFIILLLLVNLLHSAFANPLIFAINATGDIKVFQIVEGVCLITLLPISYFLFKFGAFEPQIVFIIYFVVEFITQIARILIVLPRIHISLQKYIKDAMLPIFKVILVSIPIIFILDHYNEDTWLSFIVTTVMAIISEAVVIFFWGINKIERQLIVSKIFNYNI